MNVAFIPVRGGSKSIPLKNIKEIAGKPLVYWVTEAANSCEAIDEVYIATDSTRIRDIVMGFGFEKVRVIGRTKETATDTASTESAMLEFAKTHHFDNIALIQATSPLLTSSDLDGGFALFALEKTDSVLSVVRQKRFNWKINEQGYAVSTNYNYEKRPRRQEFEGYLVENGAFYITSREALLTSRNRLSGNICAYEMDERTYFEIDEQSDWETVENQLNQRKISERRKANVSEIKMLLTDCDGCLTDGGMYYTENGDEVKKFNTRDGMAVSMLQSCGVKVGIITGESRELNVRRANKLNIDILEQGCKNKLEKVIETADKYHLNLSEIAYIGDDINDIEVIKRVGFGACPRDAIEEVKMEASYVCMAKGGEGVLREVAQRILKGCENEENRQ